MRIKQCLSASINATMTQQPTTDDLWLETFLVDAARRNLCTKIHCTTCGVKEFRNELMAALARKTGQAEVLRLDTSGALEIARGLACVQPAVDLWKIEEAARFVIYMIWWIAPRSEIEAILQGTWGGTVLDRMKAHYQEVEEKRRIFADSQNPVMVKQRRDARKNERQEQHQERIRLKRERDRFCPKTH